MDILYNAFNGFSGLIDAFNNIANIFATPLNEWLSTALNESVFGKALSVVIMPILSNAGISGFTLGSLMFGSGLSIFLMLSLGKWIVGLK